MRSFEELEEKYAQLSVHGKSRISGFLKLAGRSTEAELSGPKPFAFQKDESGWFDLDLEAKDNNRVLLHDVVVLRSDVPWIKLRRHHATLYPNFVIFNSQFLRRDRKIHKIAFRLDLFKNFFHYQSLEWHPAGRSDSDVMNTITKLREAVKSRNDGKGYEREYDFDDPHDIYVLHRVPRPISFEANRNTYEVWFGSKVHAGINGVQLDAMPTAIIRFGTPVPMDHALDALWEWRRFFSQLAMERLEPNAVAARSKGVRGRSMADFYLPNVRVEKERRGRSRLNPGTAPYNTWNERAKLADLMREWLNREKSRKSFRVLLDHVLNVRLERVSFEDIVSLCSAVDGLEELSSRTDLSKDALRAMAAAAFEAGQRTGLNVDHDRISSVIGMLKNRSLPDQLRALFACVVDVLDGPNQKLLLASVMELRTIAAHGGAILESSTPKLAATVDALAAICVLFELTTSGVPLAADKRPPLVAIGQLTESMARLREIKTMQ